MATSYHHTQRGTLMLAALLAGAVVVALAAFTNPAAVARWLLTMLAVAFVVLAWLFSSITVEVGDQELRWRFGRGLWRYRLALADIDRVEPVRNSWSSGFGIRRRPGFRLYNVSGLDAVELRLKSGAVRRLGTDDPQGLTAALKA
jgi:predicted lysophospholipase L1 biosynthesis ABC-type transport system permease subunit